MLKYATLLGILSITPAVAQETAVPNYNITQECESYNPNNPSNNSMASTYSKIECVGVEQAFQNFVKGDWKMASEARKQWCIAQMKTIKTNFNYMGMLACLMHGTPLPRDPQWPGPD